jgi:hypothetical protein
MTQKIILRQNHQLTRKMSSKIVIDWHLHFVNSDHLVEDVGTAPSEKNDNDSEKDHGRDTSDEKQSTSSLGSTASSYNTTNQIGKMVPQGKFKGKELL